MVLHKSEHFNHKLSFCFASLDFSLLLKKVWEKIAKVLVSMAPDTSCVTEHSLNYTVPLLPRLEDWQV